MNILEEGIVVRFQVLWWMLLLGMCCFFSSDEEIWSVEAPHANFHDGERRHYFGFLMPFFFPILYLHFSASPADLRDLTFSSYRIMNMNI